MSFFKYLYTDFLLRDILAKAVPGFLVLAYLFRGNIPIAHPKDALPDIVVIAVLYGLSFMTGMFLQFLGSQGRGRLRLIRIYVHDDDRDESLDHLRDFLNATDNRKYLRTQRERFVILKNMSGTYTVAIFAIAIVELIKYLALELSSFPIFAVVLILVGFLAWENRFHAAEQQHWENNGTIQNNQAEDGEEG